MPLMLGRLYDALKAANVPEDVARAAAEEVATYEQVKGDLWLLKWMMGIVVALVLGLFWMQWQLVDRLAGVEERLTNLEVGFVEMRGEISELRERLTEPTPRS